MHGRTLVVLVGALAVIVAGCGGKTTLLPSTKPAPHTTPARSAPAGSPPASTASSTPAASSSSSSSPAAPPSTRSAQSLGFPALITKNTTRVPGADAIENAAAVALAVFPSAAPGTHPAAVTLAPTDDWQAALAASSLMAAPFRAPIVLSGPGSLPTATADALNQLAPTGEQSLAGTQVFAVGDVPSVSGVHADPIRGGSDYALAAAIDGFETRARGKASHNVVIVSAQDPAYAMPAAGYSAESGEPILFVDQNEIPAATQTALLTHHHAHLYVLGPSSVISATVLDQLQRFGTVSRVGATDPAANSVAFAEYRDPACPIDAQCVHIPHSFGWAIRSPGHGYVLINASDPLDAAAAAALSSSGTYGPQLLIEDPNTLPRSVLNYFLDYATPAYTQEGPTAAVYNHGWVIGTRSAISVAVQAQVDSLLEVVPQR